MGFFDFLTGGDSTETKMQQTTKSDVVGKTTTASDATSNREQDQSATVSLLSDDVRLALEKLTLEMLGGADGVDATGKKANEVSDFIFNRAKTAEQSLLEKNAAILSEARRIGTRDVLSNTTQAAQGAGGSTGNSFVMQVANQGVSDLESQIAALDSQLSTNAREVMTKELALALQGLETSGKSSVSGTTALAQIAEVLKGSQQVSTAALAETTTSQDKTIQDIQQTINELIKGKSTTDESLGLMSIITGLAGAAGSLSSFKGKKG